MCTIVDIFKEGGILSNSNPNYKKRPSQVEAATRIEFALRNKQHFILEGPCGFGKSLSYLIPAVKNLIENDYEGQIVVVTSNISLQAQLFDKDIPFVLDIMSKLYPTKNVKRIIRPALSKGIGNFICIDKMESDEFLNNIDLLNSSKIEEVKKFYATTKDGDLTKANFILDMDTKKKVTCLTSSDCKSNLCSSKSECFYNMQKLKTKMSKLVVTNYHMLFSCKAINSSLFSDASIIIFDEVHEAETILREFTSNTITSGTVEYIERKISEIKKIAGTTYPHSTLFDVERLKDASNRYFADIQLKYNDVLLKSPKLITKQSDLPDSEDFKICISRIIKTLDKLQISVEQSIDNISESDYEKSNADDIYKTSSEGVESADDKIKGLLGPIKGLRKTCENIINMITNVNSILADDNLVMYVENRKNRTILGVKDVNVSNKFKKYFLKYEDVTCILASATISVNGSFYYLKRKLGLNQIKHRVMEYIGVSPFDLKHQELWYIPQDALPGNDKNFDAQVPRQIEEIIKATNGGALCLFTSNRNLQNCKERLSKTIPEFKILSQGDKSRAKLLDEFRGDFNASLLATKSFFTGVDIQGQSLRCVIIDKLPFSTPSDPVHQRLSSRKGYFRDYILPEMIIAFKQAVGRGVRSVDDKCIICVLDERIMTANYAGGILGSFDYEKMLTKNVETFPIYLK